MDANNAIENGYMGSGDVSLQFVVNLLRDGERYAPCDLEQETFSLAQYIEKERWYMADGTLGYIIKAVKGLNLDDQGIQWATWIGMAQKVVERAGATTQ